MATKEMENCVNQLYMITQNHVLHEIKKSPLIKTYLSEIYNKYSILGSEVDRISALTGQSKLGIYDDTQRGFMDSEVQHLTKQIISDKENFLKILEIIPESYSDAFKDVLDGKSVLEQFDISIKDSELSLKFNLKDFTIDLNQLLTPVTEFIDSKLDASTFVSSNEAYEKISTIMPQIHVSKVHAYANLVKFNTELAEIEELTNCLADSITNGDMNSFCMQEIIIECKQLTGEVPIVHDIL